MKKISDFQEKFDQLLCDQNGVYKQRWWKRKECVLFKQELLDTQIAEFNSIEEKICALRFKLKERPHCIVCGNITSADRFSKNGFRETCSVKCAAQNNKQKIKNTLQEKYGGHHTQNKEWITNFVQNQHLKNAYKRGMTTFEEKYKVKNRYQLPKVKEKIKQTCLERYGVVNPMQNKHILQKVKNTNIQKYGRENSFKPMYGLDHPMKNIETIFKSRCTKLAKKDWKKLQKNKEFTFISILHENHIAKCKQCNNEFSFKDLNSDCYNCFTKPTLQKEISNFIQSLGLKVINNERKILNGQELDIFIPTKNLAIEVNGIYWHGETQLRKRIQDVKNYHLNKTELCLQKNIQCIHIFENEWNDKQELIKSIIKSKLGIFDKIIYARKTKIQKVEHAIAKQFYEENHIQGFIPSSIHLACLYDNEIYTMMSFNNSNRFNKNEDTVELIRFAAKQNVQVIGGASKCLNYFMKNFNDGNKQIISYADRRWSNGNVYHKLGFRFLYSTKPNYFYVENGKCVSRLKFQKHKLKDKLENFDSKLSEWKNMQINGYDRIWDCGNLKFIK